MNRKKKDVIWIVVLLIPCGLIVWHAVRWHVTGVYMEMFHWLKTENGYLTALYNLGLMLISGLILANLMTKFADLFACRNCDKEESPDAEE